MAVPGTLLSPLLLLFFTNPNLHFPEALPHTSTWPQFPSSCLADAPGAEPPSQRPPSRAAAAWQRGFRAGFKAPRTDRCPDRFWLELAGLLMDFLTLSLEFHQRSLARQISAADQTRVSASCSVIHPAGPCPRLLSARSSQRALDTPRYARREEEKGERTRSTQKQSPGGLYAVRRAVLSPPPTVWAQHHLRVQPPCFARTRAPRPEPCFRGTPWTRQSCSCGADVVLPFDHSSAAPGRATLAVTLV